MVRIDRGFIGVLLIAVVISTVVMSFVTVERVKTGIEIIKNKYPPSIKSTVQERHTFVVNVIARRPYEEVKIKFSCLRKTVPAFSDPSILNKSDATLEDIAAEIAPVKACLSAAKAAPVGSDREILQVNVNGSKYEALLYDFGEVIAAGQTISDFSFAPTAYLLWRDKAGNLTYYQGSSDFFQNRNQTMESLVISHNDKETTYRSAKETGYSDIPTIAEAPMLGTVRYEGVEKDDRMYVMFAINSLSVAAHSGMIEIVRVMGNGELVDYEVNFISP